MRRAHTLLSAAFVLAALGIWLGSAFYFRPDSRPALSQPPLGEPLPAFSLPDLSDPRQNFGPADLLGDAYLLNFWASWCVSCKREHGFLLQLAQEERVKLYSVNYQDTLEAARATLERTGDPYTRTAFDAQGLTAQRYGIVGTPITFVVDKHGKLRYKHLGPVNAEVFEQIIGPLLDALEAG